MLGKLWKKIRANRKGFTLVECVLASAIIGAGATLVMSMVSMGYSYVTRSRSLDEMSSVAQERAFVTVYTDGFEAQNGLVELDEDSGISVGYSENLPVRMAYEIHYGASSKTDVIMPTDSNYVAVIVTDTRDNKIVYYMVSPKDSKIQTLYTAKENK